MLAQARTDIGKVRETNEDSFLCLPPFFVVADGMGGHVAGEVASKLAIDTIGEYVQKHRGQVAGETLLELAITHANSLIYRRAQQKPECSGMGTTVTAALIEGAEICWGHVGDSRLYIARGGELGQVTEDHSLVWELVRSGNISPEEALNHPKRNILTRAVGTNESIKIDTGTLEWNPDEKLLLCTDGLTNMVSDEELAKALLSARGNGGAVLDRLVAMACEAGGLDNITAILVENEE